MTSPTLLDLLQEADTLGPMTLLTRLVVSGQGQGQDASPFPAFLLGPYPELL